MNTGLTGGTNNKANGVTVNLKGPKGESSMDADVVLLSILKVSDLHQMS